MDISVYYRDRSGKEQMTLLDKIPESCGGCPFCSTRESYRRFDNRDAHYYIEIECMLKKLPIFNFSKDGALDFDTDQDERILEERASFCPLYEK